MHFGWQASKLATALLRLSRIRRTWLGPHFLVVPLTSAFDSANGKRSLAGPCRCAARATAFDERLMQVAVLFWVSAGPRGRRRRHRTRGRSTAEGSDLVVMIQSGLGWNQAAAAVRMII
jgi:hypothetical protein